tara:strand:- start:12 stop:365 length:354 start_codon:yes stop_codon:yes gene_type:complete
VLAEVALVVLVHQNYQLQMVRVGLDNHLLVSLHLLLHLVFRHQINLLSHLLLGPLDSMVAVVVDQVKISQALALEAPEVVDLVNKLENMELVAVADQLTTLEQMVDRDLLSFVIQYN